ncbi:serine hydrolase domain-containing protein [Virgibacillus halodenitrificans]|uniref:serine hydrolase domain-containing protein n=1 Tax=Virgibacillus halodenitrificans TaxID=1482 RepID=UPI00045C7703|nr:serine hydrolase [Virgibacillus halodenitrificans]CDQ32069.1 6-aminohexanoate-dimer hydrolase [Virgibacillus halodenitrificans]
MHIERSTPEEQQVSSEAIKSFIDTIERKGIELHSFMLVRNGKIIAEGAWFPYELDQKHEMFSVTKSITSTAIGFALDENLFSLDDKVIDFFPEYSVLDIDKKMKSITIRHLLTMTTGYFENIAGTTVLSLIKGSWIKEYFELPLTYEPGTKFVYNSATSHVLSAVLTKVTNQSLSDYLEPRLFQPLGIKEYSWDVDPQGNETGGWGMRLKTGDLAKIGQLYLQKGMWEGKQLLSKEYVEKATSFQVSSEGHSEGYDSLQGYGFQFWISRHGSYRAAGMFGQICLVLPQQNALFIVTAGTERKQEVLDVFWETIFPSFLSTDFVKDLDKIEGLEERTKNLTLTSKKPYSSSTLESHISGKKYIMKTNADEINSIEFNFTHNKCIFKLNDSTGEHQIECGLGNWIEQNTTMPGAPLHLLQQPDDLKVKARGFWENEKIFIMTWTFFEMSFTDTVICRFEENQIIYNRSVHDHGPYIAKRPTMIGKTKKENR